MTQQGVAEPLGLSNVEEVRILDLSTEVKSTTWCIAVAIKGLDADGVRVEQRLFIKKAERKLYQQEKIAVQRFSQLMVARDAKVSLPQLFVDEEALIVSKFVEGKNVKLSLRALLFNPLAMRSKQPALQLFGQIGSWLADFHTESAKNSRHTELNSEQSLRNFFYQPIIPLVDGVSNAQLLDLVRSTLKSHFHDLCSHWSTLHGDFGPQNIIANIDDFKVVDWEVSRDGVALEDCVNFVTEILVQLRHMPLRARLIKKLIGEFLRSYLASHDDAELFIDVVTLLAISRVLKRQEWSGNPFLLPHKVVYLPVLRSIAKESYSSVMLNDG